ncbi:hypothetical protein MF271_10515 [Deinococcus sp. KNUC1210]|uniref:hypothetical protein n=1 Tax=Deinococcus sp. KNUC1210 TaxID=2917691 RepID=UPI001EEF8C1F|nr:hypothetical protein [Deinococcus sp. KNUC1210]ULH14466.1 hypothetical protein MF271_10515 [Deinococcus sp. KNUC1210]
MSEAPDDASPIRTATRLVSGGLRGNLAWVMHRDQPQWRYPEQVSRTVQLLSSLTLLLALPLPELLAGLDAQPMTPRKRRLFEHPDFDATNAEGFRAGIGALRRALASAHCEFLMTEDQLLGLRAWQEGSGQPGVVSWELRFDRERLERVVTTLLEVMVYSGMPLTPQPDEPPAAPRRRGTRATARTAKRDES